MAFGKNFVRDEGGASAAPGRTATAIKSAAVSATCTKSYSSITGQGKVIGGSGTARAADKLTVLCGG